MRWTESDQAVMDDSSAMADALGDESWRAWDQEQADEVEAAIDILRRMVRNLREQCAGCTERDDDWRVGCREEIGTSRASRDASRRARRKALHEYRLARPLQPRECAEHGIQTCHACPDLECGDNDTKPWEEEILASAKKGDTMSETKIVETVRETVPGWRPDVAGRLVRADCACAAAHQRETEEAPETDLSTALALAVERSETARLREQLRSMISAADGLADAIVAERYLPGPDAFSRALDAYRHARELVFGEDG